jgi:hypothetical protein
MAFTGAKGQLRMLRVNDLGHVYGPPTDAIHTEVVAALAGSDIAFGFVLRADDPNLPARANMLSVLRDAFLHNLPIDVSYDLPEGKRNGHLRRVELTR